MWLLRIAGSIQSMPNLCAQRTGPCGSERINAILVREMVADVANAQEPVHGLPFMIRRNQAKLDLWNGIAGSFIMITSSKACRPTCRGRMVCVV